MKHRNFSEKVIVSTVSSVSEVKQNHEATFPQGTQHLVPLLVAGIVERVQRGTDNVHLVFVRRDVSSFVGNSYRVSKSYKAFETRKGTVWRHEKSQYASETGWKNTKRN